MPITFRYKTFERKDGIACYGPWIPLTVKGPNATIDIVFLLDSGADYTVLPIELAEILGLDLSNPKEQTEGVGGEIDTIYSKMDVEIKNAHEKYRFRIPIHVILDPNSHVPPLLGREVFFDKFHITFDQSNGKVIFSRAFKHGV